MKDSTSRAAHSASSMFFGLLISPAGPVQVDTKNVKYQDGCLITIPVHTFFGFPIQHDRWLRCSGDPIVLSKTSRSFSTKPGWVVVNGKMYFSPFGSTKVLPFQIFRLTPAIHSGGVLEVL
ncbi:B3 domain-containing transcription factor [Trichinella pseudospiralis]